MVRNGLIRFRGFAERHFPDLVLGLLLAAVSGVLSILCGAAIWCYHVQFDLHEIKNQAMSFPKAIDELKSALSVHGNHLVRLDERITDHSGRIGHLEGKLEK